MVNFVATCAATPPSTSVSATAVLVLICHFVIAGHSWCEAQSTGSAAATFPVPIATSAPPVPLPVPFSPLDGPPLDATPSWAEMIRAVALTAIPDRYEDTKNWGKTKEVFGGVRVQQRGLNVRFSERKRIVNHGMWHRYKIELMDPAKTLVLLIDQVRPLGLNQFQFQLRLGSKLRCRGDFEHWLLGVKGLNFTIVSEADVEILADCELSIRTKSNSKSFLPDLLLEPKVNRVHIFLKNVDVRRIGEVRGDLAEGIGDVSRREVENLLKAQEPRVAKKINEAIEKQRKSLVIPASRIW